MQIFRLGPFRNAYLLRGLLLWAGIRAAFLVFGLVSLTGVASLGVLVVVGAGVYLDARRRDEDLFLGNLGVSGLWIPLAGLPIPIVLELVLP